jgi:hypothetical protein
MDHLTNFFDLKMAILGVANEIVNAVIKKLTTLLDPKSSLAILNLSVFFKSKKHSKKGE